MVGNGNYTCKDGVKKNVGAGWGCSVGTETDCNKCHSNFSDSDKSSKYYKKSTVYVTRTNYVLFFVILEQNEK